MPINPKSSDDELRIKVAEIPLGNGLVSQREVIEEMRKIVQAVRRDWIDGEYEKAVSRCDAALVLSSTSTPKAPL